jgi:hypothetical protein
LKFKSEVGAVPFAKAPLSSTPRAAHQLAMTVSMMQHILNVIAGLDPAIHVLLLCQGTKTWMAGSSPAITR